jgi:hypothetical protein
MKLPEAIELLKTANKWRRGGEGPMPDPKQVGIAIDTVIKHYQSKPIRQPSKNL